MPAHTLSLRGGRNRAVLLRNVRTGRSKGFERHMPLRPPSLQHLTAQPRGAQRTLKTRVEGTVGIGRRRARTPHRRFPPQCHRAHAHGQVGSAAARAPATISTPALARRTKTLVESVPISNSFTAQTPRARCGSSELPCKFYKASCPATTAATARVSSWECIG